MNRQPLDSLKGIGEKTGRLFAKLGIETVDELLEYYPRAYDACEEPVSVGRIKASYTAPLVTLLSLPTLQCVQPLHVPTFPRSDIPICA